MKTAHSLRSKWPYIAVAVLAATLIAVKLNAHKPTTQAASSEEPYSIFIVAGQSNAAGVASYKTQLDPGEGFNGQHFPGDDVTKFWWAGADGNGNPTLQVLFPGYSGSGVMGWVDSGQGRPNPTTDKLLDDINGFQTTNLLGSEFGIARTLWQAGRTKVIVLKVAYGFQTLAQSNSPTVPFDWNVNSRDKSYDRLKSEFKLLTNLLRSRGDKYTVDGFLWMQGESDTLQESYSQQYQTNLTALLTNLRTDLELQPQAHMVIGKTGLRECLNGSFPFSAETCGYPYARSLDPFAFEPLGYNLVTYEDFNFQLNHTARINRVRAAQQTVADTLTAAGNPIDVVETDDLLRGQDQTHLMAKGQIELGRRFVNMYKLPARYTGSRADDYDQDGIPNSQEDVGRGYACPLIVNGDPVTTQGDGNLGNDDSDCDGYPDYLDNTPNPGSGL